jgi:hypothetical protein
MTSRALVLTAVLCPTMVMYSICSASFGSLHTALPVDVCSTYVPNGL